MPTKMLHISVFRICGIKTSDVRLFFCAYGYTYTRYLQPFAKRLALPNSESKQMNANPRLGLRRSSTLKGRRNLIKSYNKKELGLPRPFLDLGARFRSRTLLGPGSCSHPLPSSILWPSSPSPFCQHGWERCHKGEFLSLFGCRLSAYTNSDMATTDDVRARIPLHYCHVFFLANEQPSQVYAYSQCFLSAMYHMEITGNSISCVAFVFFFLGGGVRCDNRTDSIIFHKQGVAPSSRENAGGRASEAIEDHMDVDVNVQSMGSGLNLRFIHSIIDATFSSFFLSFFSTAQESIMDLASPIENSGTHCESDCQVLYSCI